MKNSRVSPRPKSFALRIMAHVFRTAGSKAMLFALVTVGFNAISAAPSLAQAAYLNSLVGSWSGVGRAASTDGEVPIECSVNSRLSGPNVRMRARCATSAQSGNLEMSLYYSDMSRRFHGRLASPLNYMRGSLQGTLDRGDLFLRLSADDGGTGRLVFVSEGEGRVRLLVTTIVNGNGVTVLDLPLTRL